MSLPFGSADALVGLLGLARPSEVSKHFRHSRWDVPWEVLVIGLGGVLVVLVTISAARWWRSRYVDPTPLVLFSAIARRAGLGWSDRLLLWRIARAAKLSSPIALLLARGALTHHSDAFRKRQGPRGSQRTRRRVQRIQSRLFGPPTATPSPVG